MASFLAKRITLMIVTMLCASFVVFAVSEFTPGSVARRTLGPYATQQQVDLLAQRMHA
jgi:peptide/nickel transport system permease protein